MTVKRFKYVEFTRNILSFDDNGVCKFFKEQDFEDWLNKLHEENKKLKQVNEMLQMDFTMTERNLIEENERLKNKLKDWHQRTFKAYEYFNLLEKIIEEVCNDDISNQIWKEYEKREKLIE